MEATEPSAAAGLAGTLSAAAPAMLLVAVLILLLFAAGELLRRRGGVQVEWTRKLSHVGAGALVMGFPWMFSSPIPVAALGGAFLVLLLLGRLTGMLGSVHDVERQTSGAYLYPLAVVGTFWMSAGDPLLFCAPIAVMALADTGAAVVGKERGSRRYQVMDGWRSLEGSLTFFALAFGVLAVSMALAQRPGWPAMLLVTLVVAVVTTATEAISVKGLDNLLIPYAAFLVLDRSLRLGLRDLSGWIEGMILGLLLVVGATQRARLTVAGGVTVFLQATLAWALGGLQWALPMGSLFLLLLLSRPSNEEETDLDEVFPAVVGSFVVLLAFAHVPDEQLFVPYLASLCANGGIALARLAVARSWPLAPLAMAGLLAPLLPPLATARDLPWIVLVASGAIGMVAFRLLRRAPRIGRRLLASLLAAAVGWVAAG